MDNLTTLEILFRSMDELIEESCLGDADRRQMLERFCFRLLCVFDGIEGPTIGWRGVALVAPSDLPEGVDEINDDFLHDEWSNRSRPGGGGPAEVGPSADG
jgi:hypothetical protein